jgi:hypothetical protein
MLAVIAPSPRRARPASHVPHSFFDPDARQVAIYDVTNTRARRRTVRTLRARRFPGTVHRDPL